MRDVARTNAKFQDLIGKHDDSLQGRLMAFVFNVLDSLNDEGRRDFVDLFVTERFDDVGLQSSALVRIAHDAPPLEIAPKKKRVSQRVAARRFLSDVLAHFARFLFGFTIRDFREVPEVNISHSSIETLTENPSF